MPLHIRCEPAHFVLFVVDPVLEKTVMTCRSQKNVGAYYTPERVVSTLVHWVLRNKTDRLLDPSCGDGRFISRHQNSVGIERDCKIIETAKKRAPEALIHEGDFFAWAACTQERFECAAGNPPFIRYQIFNGEVRDRALRLCASLGVTFSRLTSSWAPFLVATTSLLKPGGRMAFVVPAEIGHASYAAPLLDYLAANFDTVQIIAIRDKLFPKLSEDCWLLYADGFGGTTPELRFSMLDRFSSSPHPPRQAVRVPMNEWRDTWNRRLRPYLLPWSVRVLYQTVVTHPASMRFGNIASIGIGYVSGANNFFHLRPSEVQSWQIPKEFLYPTVRNGHVLPRRQLTKRSIERWWRSNEPMMLLRIGKNAELPSNVRRYLDTEEGMQAREAFKCRTRKPWYSIPDVRVPDFFLTYMSGLAPSLVRNSAAATCTNTVHGVHVHDKNAARRVVRLWNTLFVRLSCEVEGHPLGGGMLKLEPREATRIVFPAPALSVSPSIEVEEAISTLRAWRHYAVGQ